MSNGQTALIDGTYSGIMVGESDAGRGLLIVFSDGVDVELAARRCRARRRQTIRRRRLRSVGGVAAQPEFLRDITPFTGGRLFEIEKTTNLAATFLDILDEFRHRYLVSYTPKDVAKDGWHQTRRARQESPGHDQARPGYLAGS